MPRKSTSTKVVVQTKVVKKQAIQVIAKPKTLSKRSGPKGRVKEAILSALAKGPKTGAQLLEGSGFSVSSLYLNLAQLKAEKRVTGGGRGVPIRLVDAAVSAQPAIKPKQSLPVEQTPVVEAKPASKVVVLSNYVSGPLHDALEAVSARFTAPDRIGEKLHALEQLSKTLPAPVAEVLMSIREDLLRLSPARAKQ